MPFLRRPKFDVVVVAVKYKEPGLIDWVRAFERRGATWSDRRMIRRGELLDRIRAGERVVTGERIRYEASTFKTGEAVLIEDNNGNPVLVTAAVNGSGDALQNVPIL